MYASCSFFPSSAFILECRKVKQQQAVIRAEVHHIDDDGRKDRQCILFVGKFFNRLVETDWYEIFFLMNSRLFGVLEQY
jgi:hypothetical protein